MDAILLNFGKYLICRKITENAEKNAENGENFISVYICLEICPRLPNPIIPI